MRTQRLDDVVPWPSTREPLTRTTSPGSIAWPRYGKTARRPWGREWLVPIGMPAARAPSTTSRAIARHRRSANRSPPTVANDLAAKFPKCNRAGVLTQLGHVAADERCVARGRIEFTAIATAPHASPSGIGVVGVVDDRRPPGFEHLAAHRHRVESSARPQPFRARSMPEQVVRRPTAASTAVEVVPPPDRARSKGHSATRKLSCARYDCWISRRPRRRTATCRPTQVHFGTSTHRSAARRSQRFLDRARPGRRCGSDG